MNQISACQKSVVPSNLCLSRRTMGNLAIPFPRVDVAWNGTGSPPCALVNCIWNFAWPRLWQTKFSLPWQQWQLSVCMRVARTNPAWIHLFACWYLKQSLSAEHIPAAKPNAIVKLNYVSLLNCTWNDCTLNVVWWRDEVITRCIRNKKLQSNNWIIKFGVVFT